MRELSSRQTFLVKWIVPPAWIGAFGSATIALWYGATAVPLTDTRLRWLFPVVWLLGSLFIYLNCVRLKRVRLDGSTLLVSDYRREIRIPLRDVEAVTELRWVNIHPVTLHLRRPSDFGERIVFMPPTRWFMGWLPHPLVQELRDLVHQERLEAIHPSAPPPQRPLGAG